MTVESLALSTVKLLADQVKHLMSCRISFCQVLMLNESSLPMSFWELNSNDTSKDLTMFTMTNLTLFRNENSNMVVMTLNLRRKVTTELLTTYLPTILLLIITFVTIFFDKDLFGDAIAVNLTIMLVMTTIFTSKIEELPPTSDMKMIDFWLIFCLIVPFLEVLISTSLQYVSCSCPICAEEENPPTQQAKVAPSPDQVVAKYLHL